jgi:hypothetical protein
VRLGFADETGSEQAFRIDMLLRDEAVGYPNVSTRSDPLLFPRHPYDRVGIGWERAYHLPRLIGKKSISSALAVLPINEHHHAPKSHAFCYYCFVRKTGYTG